MYDKNYFVNLPKTNDRYMDFTVLDNPVVITSIENIEKADVIQLHDVKDYGKGIGICGFCGVCKVVDGKVVPMDGDTYSDETIVYGYEWFDYEDYEDNKPKKGIEVMVLEW